MSQAKHTDHLNITQGRNRGRDKHTDHNITQGRDRGRDKHTDHNITQGRDRGRHKHTDHNITQGSGERDKHTDHNIKGVVKKEHPTPVPLARTIKPQGPKPAPPEAVLTASMSGPFLLGGIR